MEDIKRSAHRFAMGVILYGYINVYRGFKLEPRLT